MKKNKDENLGPNKYNPKDRISTNMIINQRTGNYMFPRQSFNPRKKMKRVKRIINMTEQSQTQIKPEKSVDRPAEVKISDLDVDMFQNVVRDLGRLSNVTSKLIDDIEQSKGEHYDEYVMKLKRIFEPLVVTMQRLPDHKDDLGQAEPKEEPSPEDQEKLGKPQDLGKNTIAGSGETELDKAVEKEKQGRVEDPEDIKKDMKKNRLSEAKTTGYVDKVALKTRKGRIVWVKRSKVPQYIAKKGYTMASGAVPRSKKKKLSRPRKTIKKLKMTEGTGGIYTGAGTHNIMPQDKQELLDQFKGQNISPQLYTAHLKSLQGTAQVYQKLIATERDQSVKNFYQERLNNINNKVKKIGEFIKTQSVSTGVTSMQEENRDKRIIMRGTDGKTYAVRARKVQKYLDKGFSLEKDTVTQQPKNLRVNEAKLDRIVDEEVSRIVSEIAKKEVKSLKKK